MSVVRVVEDKGVSDDNAEELLKILCINGVPLDGQDPKCDDFVAGLDGSVAASLDASGIKIVNGSVFVTITETEPDPASKLYVEPFSLIGGSLLKLNLFSETWTNFTLNV